MNFTPSNEDDTIRPLIQLRLSGNMFCNFYKIGCLRIYHTLPVREHLFFCIESLAAMRKNKLQRNRLGKQQMQMVLETASVYVPFPTTMLEYSMASRKFFEHVSTTNAAAKFSANTFSRSFALLAIFIKNSEPRSFCRSNPRPKTIAAEFN